MANLFGLNLRAEDGLRLFGQAPPVRPAPDRRPDHLQADLGWIRGALAHSQRRPSGGWYVVDDRHAIDATPQTVRIDGRELVVHRQGDRFHAAPAACPHMGASLAGARVCDGALVCPWHGLRLGPEGHAGWRPLRTHDDGRLLWVQLPQASGVQSSGADKERSDPPTDAPAIPARPAGGLEAVIRTEAACEPRDVIQNRLDPWHGVHFHPHSFARLRVIEQRDDEITVRVAYRVMGSLAVEVDARFHCPDPRTIVMTIVAGEGQGSIVETHATPMGPGRTAVIELTVATSDRPGFAVAERGRALIRPLMQWAARRLWIEDAAYAERLYALRAQGSGRSLVERSRSERVPRTRTSVAVL